MGTNEIKKEAKRNPAFIPFSQRQIIFEKDYNKFQTKVLQHMSYNLQDNSYPTEEELTNITKKYLPIAKEAEIENGYIVFLYYLCQRFVETNVIIKDYNIFKTLENLIMDLKSSLVKRAKGYDYEEKTVTKSGENDKEPTIQIKLRHCPADVGAAIFLLKNIDRENWADNWHNKELKEKELELKKMLAEHQINDW